MFEKIRISRAEAATDDAPRTRFLGAIGVLHALKELYPSSGTLAKAAAEMQQTEPTLGDVAKGIEADLNDAAALHAEYQVTDAADDELGSELDFEWFGDFPDKNVGYIDPDDPTSGYQSRAG